MVYSETTQIQSPYLLLTFIPFYQDESGGVWLDRSWHRDFERHRDYINDLTLVAPGLPYDATIPDLVQCAPTRGSGTVRFVALKAQSSLSRALRHLPNTLITLWKEVKRARIVHSGIIGWPIPLGWFANPMALLLRRKLVLVVESAPWRIKRPGVRAKIMSFATERLGRFFMNRADLAIATQPSYLDSLRPNPRNGEALVNPASWIEESEIIAHEELVQQWNARQELPPRFLFAGRLDKGKGVDLLLEAIQILNVRSVPINIDIIGSGPLLDECERMARSESCSTVLRILKPVPYGPAFFSLLQEYHAVVIPNIGDEQPRILFDAFSQGVPAIASNTDGISPYIGNGGWLVNPVSAAQFAHTLQGLLEDPADFAKRGFAARELAKKVTHQVMHATRSRALALLDSQTNAAKH